MMTTLKCEKDFSVVLLCRASILGVANYQLDFFSVTFREKASVLVCRSESLWNDNCSI